MAADIETIEVLAGGRPIRLHILPELTRAELDAAIGRIRPTPPATKADAEAAIRAVITAGVQAGRAAGFEAGRAVGHAEGIEAGTRAGLAAGRIVERGRR